MPEEKKDTDWVTPVAVVGGAAAMAAGAWLLLKTTKPPKEVEEGEWGSSETILARLPFQCVILEGVEVGWKPAYTELARLPFQVQILSHIYPPPVINTLPAENITHENATLRARLISEGYCSGTMCYFQWGETINYGYKTPEYRCYPYPDPRSDLSVDIIGLKRETIYHFRAVAVGRCVSPETVGLGDDMVFTTKATVIQGFTMGVRNPPAGAVSWVAGAMEEVYGAPKMYEWKPIPISSTWVWENIVGDISYDFMIGACQYSYGGPFIQLDRFPFRFRNGKNYIWDFSAHKMLEV